MSRPAASRAIWFTAPGVVDVRTAPLPPPGPGQARLRTLVSAISPGTELLFLHGRVPPGMAVDAALPGMSAEASFPLKYGYSAVGVVEEVTPPADPALVGRAAFAFHPHESAFWTDAAGLVILPEGMDPARAALLSNMETAVNLVMDGRPVVGERVAVVGAGVVGLLTAALLARFPLAHLTVVEPQPVRRAAALRLGASSAHDSASYPADVEACYGRHALAIASAYDIRAHDTSAHDIRAHDTSAHDLAPGSFDLVYELSGSPTALDTAIALAGFAGRVVVGSWYGDKQAPLDLGGRFHRSRIRLLSSQVSTLAPEYTGRWDKARRLAVALALLAEIDAAGLITHRFALDDAPAAYAAAAGGEAIQVILEH